MPTCTVGRNRFGSRDNSKASFALRLPSSARCSKRPRRAAMMAISAAAKKPLASTNTKISRISQTSGEMVFALFRDFVRSLLQLDAHFAHQELHVLPAVFFSRRISQQVRWVKGAHDL